VKRYGDTTAVHHRQNRESGQAMVEFVLVLIPLLVFVGGVIQLGTGIANWHDLNRIANEGARYAAINEWPNCPSGLQPCNAYLTQAGGEIECHPADPTDLDDRSLSHYLTCEAVDAGLPAIIPEICHLGSGANATIGDPITVRLRYRVNFISSDTVDPAATLDDPSVRQDPHWLGVNLVGEATMRIERTPSTAPGACP
jgi:hypothetical protein